MDFEGLSGRVHFDNGVRRDVKLDIMELSQNGLKTVSCHVGSIFVVTLCIRNLGWGGNILSDFSPIDLPHRGSNPGRNGGKLVLYQLN